jgi:putative ABC transport system ATP-binding protein
MPKIRSDAESLIVCRALCRTFVQGGQQIHGLDELSLCIERGEFVCLSGPSGSGKTTLLNALGGLDRPDSGEVLIEGIALGGLSAGELAELRLHRIGFVFQAYNLVPVLSAVENVAFVMDVQGVPPAQSRARALAMLEEVGLPRHAGRRPAELSGGQQQRVAVARALVSGPQLVLADEPTANLDTQSAAQLMDLFADLNQRLGVTFVIATHDPRVMAYAARRITMEDGRIVSDVRQTPCPGGA